jgi:hypothetical protein
LKCSRPARVSSTMDLESSQQQGEQPVLSHLRAAAEAVVAAVVASEVVFLGVAVPAIAPAVPPVVAVAVPVVVVLVAVVAPVVPAQLVDPVERVVSSSTSNSTGSRSSRSIRIGISGGDDVQVISQEWLQGEVVLRVKIESQVGRARSGKTGTRLGIA